MEDMTFNDAVNAVEGMLRFNRALAVLEASMDKIMEGKAILDSLDQEKVKRQEAIQTAETNLKLVEEQLSNKQDLLAVAMEEIKAKADAKFDALVTTKQKQVDALTTKITKLEDQVEETQAKIDDLGHQKAIVQSSIESAQSILLDLKNERDELLAKFK